MKLYKYALVLTMWENFMFAISPKLRSMLLYLTIEDVVSILVCLFFCIILPLATFYHFYKDISLALSSGEEAKAKITSVKYSGREDRKVDVYVCTYEFLTQNGRKIEFSWMLFLGAARKEPKINDIIHIVYNPLQPTHVLKKTTADLIKGCFGIIGVCLGIICLIAGWFSYLVEKIYTILNTLLDFFGVCCFLLYVYKHGAEVTKRVNKWIKQYIKRK